jgi:hypothetical protein
VHLVVPQNRRAGKEIERKSRLKSLVRVRRAARDHRHAGHLVCLECREAIALQNELHRHSASRFNFLRKHLTVDEQDPHVMNDGREEIADALSLLLIPMEKRLCDTCLLLAPVENGAEDVLLLEAELRVKERCHENSTRVRGELTKSDEMILTMASFESFKKPLVFVHSAAFSPINAMQRSTKESVHFPPSFS